MQLMQLMEQRDGEPVVYHLTDDRGQVLYATDPGVFGGIIASMDFADALRVLPGASRIALRRLQSQNRFFLYIEVVPAGDALAPTPPIIRL